MTDFERAIDHARSRVHCNMLNIDSLLGQIISQCTKAKDKFEREEETAQLSMDSLLVKVQRLNEQVSELSANRQALANFNWIKQNPQ